MEKSYGVRRQARIAVRGKKWLLSCEKLQQRERQAWWKEQLVTAMTARVA